MHENKENLTEGVVAGGGVKNFFYVDPPLLRTFIFI